MLNGLLIKLNRVASLLQSVRYLFIALAVCALLLTGFSLLIDNSFTASALEPSIVTALWCLLILAFSKLFETIPPPVLPHDHFLRRLAAQARLLLYALLALGILIVALLLLGMSIRLMSI